MPQDWHSVDDAQVNRPAPRSRPRLSQDDDTTYEDAPDTLLSLCQANMGGQWLVRFDNCPFPPNDLRVFAAMAVAGQQARVPAAGVIRCPVGKQREMIGTLVDTICRATGSQALPFEIVARLGASAPFPVLQIERGFEMLHETDPDELAVWRQNGMINTEQCFDHRLLNSRFFLLICNLDEPAPFTDRDRRKARRILARLMDAGCPILGIYSDPESAYIATSPELFGEHTVIELEQWS